MQSVALSSIVVLVLAAGKGRRFAASGAQVHKLQAMLEGVSVLDRVCQSVAEAGLLCHVVQPAGDATDGMGDSIAHGVQAMSDAAGWLILPGDMPLVRPETLRAVAAALQAQPDGAAVIPQYQHQRGHPVAFSAPCGPALRRLQGDMGARVVLQALKAQETQRGVSLVQTLIVDDPGVLYDIDTLDDLAAASRYIKQMRQTFSGADLNS
ncbi:nucleotidyltransferase family protein [Comamonas kerstersii]|uniref:nucleotidyltransferase family protein n=1 Tax=Comamonas kerstersii TaxID=225992 RepID=UPI003A8F15DE